MKAKLSTYVFFHSPPTTLPLHKTQYFTSLNCYWKPGPATLLLCPSVENSKLKVQMERGFANSHQFYGALYDRKVKHKYHCLLEDFLELQKEFVSKKKKLQTQKQKREMLVEELRFLRQRYNYLTKSQLSKVESELCVSQNADIPDVPISRDLNYIINKEGTGREVLAWTKPGIKKKLNNCLTDDNKRGKRKISWQDKVALGV